MPITAQQREQRRHHLGSSDMASILGVDPWRNAYDVFLEKTGKVEDLKENEAMYLGTALEDGVLTFAEDQLGKLKRNQYRSAQGFPIASNIDAIVVASEEPVEAKTAGLLGPMAEPWGDPGTDDLPDRVIIQAHCHMLCTDKEICHVPALLGGKGFVMYHVTLDKVILDLIMEKSTEFWDDYVLKDVPPPDVMPSYAMAKRMKRTPGKVVKIDEVLVVNWESAKGNLKVAKEIREAAEAELLTALGDADAGEYGTEGMLLTYFEQCRRSVRAKELRDAYPKIYAKFENVSHFRVARTKKPKKKKFDI